MSKVFKFLIDPLDLLGSRADAKAKKKEEKRQAMGVKAEAKQKSRIIADQPFRESSSLLGGRPGSTQTGTLLGG